MFFTEDTKGIEQVKKNLKGVAIALVILGLSRFIVSFIFDFYKGKLLKDNSSDTTQTQNLSSRVFVLESLS
jgi:hypothetical protein